MIAAVLKKSHVSRTSPRTANRKAQAIRGHFAAPRAVERPRLRSRHPTQGEIGVPGPSALRFLVSPDLMKLGQAYVEGTLRVEGPILEVFRVAESLARAAASRGSSGLRRVWRHTRRRDRDAIRYHYDVSNDFYSLWLDRNMVYSCAYFRSETDSLDAAQEQKLDHILNKLMLGPGERFLDIGCGWGALILRAAKKYGAR